MKIIPVLDLLGGTAVRGIAGRRSEYRPVRSVLAAGSDPGEVARGYCEILGLREIYLADLDAILNGRPNTALYRELAEQGVQLLIDAGLREPEEGEAVLASGAHALIAGLETLSGPAALRNVVREFGPQRVIFSLDLRQGRPLGDRDAWGSRDPLQIGCRAVELGVRRMIVLDLADVGTGLGPGSLELCGRLQSACPGLQIMTGGGVRNLDDLRAAADRRIDGVVVASALHDGSIGRAQLEELCSRVPLHRGRP